MYSPFTHSDTVIARGSIILTSLLVATLISSYATVEAAVRSGEVTEYVINPSIQAYNSFVSEIEKQAAEDTKRKSRAPQFTDTRKVATNSAVINIETNVTTQTNGSTTTTSPTQSSEPTQRIIITPNTTNANLEQEAKDRQAKSQAEYEAAVKKMNEDYNARVQENNTRYNENVEESNKKMEETRKKNQEEFDAFKADHGL